MCSALSRLYSGGKVYCVFTCMSKSECTRKSEGVCRTETPQTKQNQFNTKLSICNYRRGPHCRFVHSNLHSLAVDGHILHVLVSRAIYTVTKPRCFPFLLVRCVGRSHRQQKYCLFDKRVRHDSKAERVCGDECKIRKLFY